MQLETLRLTLERHGRGRALIVCPLGVRIEFAADAAKLGIHTRFIRRDADVAGDGIYITNYESVRDGRLDPPYEGYMEVGRQVILYQSGPRELSTLLCWRCEDLAPVPARDRHRVVLDAYAGTWPVLRQIINGAVDWEAAYLDALGQIEMPRWWDGRTVLMGDAAWGLSFLSGQGASMAMAGAYLLAQALRTAGMGGGSAIPSGALAQALAAWEAGLRPTLTRVQQQARAMARSYVPRSAAGLWLNRRLLPLLMSRPLLKLRARHLVAPSLIAPADLDGGRPPVAHSGRG